MTAISSFLGLLYLLMLMPLDWGFKGHQVVGAIASQHLTPKAQQAVAQLLEDYQDFNALMDQLPIPTGVQVRDIASQTLAQWVAETHALAYEVYDNAPPNSNLSSVYQKENLPLVYQQLQKAGLRLAATLNTIFK